MIYKIASIEDAMASYHLTRSQMSKCAAVQNGATGEYFYLVQSESQPGVEYKVIYNRESKVMQCLPFNGPVCKASEAGYNCWHKRAAKASHILYLLEIRKLHEVEIKEAEAQRLPEETEEQALIARLVGEGWNLETATRVAYAKGPQHSEREIRAAQVENSIRAKGFRLLK